MHFPLNTAMNRNRTRHRQTTRRTLHIPQKHAATHLPSNQDNGLCFVRTPLPSFLISEQPPSPFLDASPTCTSFTCRGSHKLVSTSQLRPHTGATRCVLLLIKGIIWTEGCPALTSRDSSALACPRSRTHTAKRIKGRGTVLQEEEEEEVQKEEK